MTTPSPILDFIAKFNSHDCLQVLEETFTNGFCYYFAVMLKARFPEVVIYYDQIAGHFISLYQFKFYDVTGHLPKYDAPNQENVRLIEWNKMEAYDELLFECVLNDCVLKAN
jgi:hypothetical protein